ncbi:hypothetical protein [Pseudomonas aeruginosa]|uniref:hypothetical protein n=1 Tax=Pseudomonas aeruginosa TaxID=287 RepID=UPI0012987928|nr:hypothetical protein [Pseudomonas aeruginosa]
MKFMTRFFNSGAWAPLLGSFIALAGYALGSVELFCIGVALHAGMLLALLYDRLK